MNNLVEKFLSVLNALQQEGVDYVLIGGFAVVLHGSSRFTEDMDIFIRNTEKNIERLRKALNSVFNDDSISEITSQEIQNYAVIRYGTAEDFYIDIIGSIGEKFSYDDILSEEIIVEGVKIKIATVESLYKLKEKTFGAVDQNDLLFLAEKLKSKRKND